LHRYAKWLRSCVALVSSIALTPYAVIASPPAVTASAMSDDVVALRKAVVEAIATSGCGFAGRREYCMTDSAEIDATIKRLVGKYFAGLIPIESAHRAELVAYAHTDMIAALRSPGGLQWLEARTRERFERPTITTYSGRVLVDVGFVPGTLSVGPRARIALANSSHVERGQWRSAEVAAHLARYVADFPHLPVIDVVALIADSHNTRWTYRFERAAGRILVFNDTMPTGAYVTEGHVDATLSDYVAGRRSLATDQLRWLRTAQVVR
jgi:hypothetical protein